MMTALAESFVPLVAGHVADLRAAGLLREALFIDGEWVAASDGGTLEVTDPASGESVAHVASATPEDVRRAVAAAERARHGWWARPATERADVLLRWHDLIKDSQEQLALLLTIEEGKPLVEARGEIAYSAAFVRFYAEEARRGYGEVIPGNRSSRRLFALRQPVGVVAAITPWNFPALMIARKVAPALAAGCGVVLKPPSEAPLSGLALAELGARAGLPAGIFNVVHGKLLMAQCAGTVKRMALELGGNSPFIVFDDADIGAAVQGAIDSKFRNAGQTCVCANRILVQSRIHDAFVERFSDAVNQLKVGHGLDAEVAIGPLIEETAVAKVERHLSDATSKGAHVVSGGQRHELGGTSGMELASGETFGPVAPFFRFETEEEALALANSTSSGLAAYFYTKDLGRAFRVGEGLEFGVVGVNTGIISYEGAPFGGMKESGFGREGSHHGLEEFLEVKYLCVDGI
jgi:succinate-semialdehyde dehydrogenase/glutarate-semialdehyde dehydrogenase